MCSLQQFLLKLLGIAEEEEKSLLQIWVSEESDKNSFSSCEAVMKKKTNILPTVREKQTRKYFLLQLQCSDEKENTSFTKCKAVKKEETPNYPNVSFW